MIRFRKQIASLCVVTTFAFSISSPAVVAQEPANASPESKVQTNSRSLPAEVKLETVLEKYRERGEKKWEEKIAALESCNAKEGAWPADSLLFFGSSSFRLWETMGSDMAPFPAINRGYGGAKYVDMVLFADRMLTAHQYRALMLFAANDAKGDEDDSSPEEVACAVKEIICVSKDHLPDAPIFIVEVTPTESRWKSWDRTRKINETLREIALTTENAFFIATAQHYLNPNGTPRQELFVDDKLHLNQDGYTKWAGLIKTQLNSFLPSQKSTAESQQSEADSQ